MGAQTPTNITATIVLAYEMTIEWDVNLGLDYTFRRWRIQIVEGFYDADPGYLEPEPPWRDAEDCEEQAFVRQNSTCRITGLESYTLYSIRIKETCTDYIFDSFWGYMNPTFTAMPIPAGPPQNFRVSPVDTARYFVPNHPLAIYAFFFDVRWTAAFVPGGECIFKRWQLQSRRDGEDWKEEACIALRTVEDPRSPLDGCTCTRTLRRNTRK